MIQISLCVPLEDQCQKSWLLSAIHQNQIYQDDESLQPIQEHRGRECRLSAICQNEQLYSQLFEELEVKFFPEDKVDDRD